MSVMAAPPAAVLPGAGPVPFATGPATAAERRGPVRGGARQQLLHFACAHDQRGAVARLLRERGIEGHEFAVKLEGVPVERGEQRRVGQVEVGLIERDLRRVDRPCDHDAFLDHLLPGGAPSALFSHSAG